MEENDEYKKLPIEEKCVHKLWKARVNGYEEVAKLFRQIDDEKSPEFGKYLGLVKKFVVDSNVMGQEKGLEATLAFVENYAHAGKTVGEVMSGIVAKCVAAPKAKTRELALQVTLMYIEIEKYEAVQEELIKGTEQKNPKIVSACIQSLTTALREFGIKIMSPKPMIKKIGPLFSDRDKAVRDEARLMVIELFRWMGPALRPHLQSANLQAVQLAELETQFASLEGTKSVPLRYIRSQQQKQAAIAAAVVEGDEGDEEEDDENDAPQDIDPYDIADPVDILSKLPKDFFEKIEAKKWQERKEVLEAVENLVKSPKLENGEYGDLIRALKKVIQKDSNVICVALAGKCIAGLASGLKKRFATYASALTSTLLEKFKEKKQNVVTALREAIDALYVTTTLENVLDDVLEALNNKNPSVRSETSFFLARALTKTQPTAVNKKLLKALTGALTKNLNESDPGVREASAECLGTLMKLVGEKAIGPFLIDIEKDNLKMAKVKEYCDKAVITVKAPAAKKEKPKPATKAKKEGGAGGKTALAPRAVIKKPGAAPALEKKKPPPNNLSGTATVVRSKAPKNLAKLTPKIEKELEDFEVDQIVEELFDSTVVAQLMDSLWKNRLAAAEDITSRLQEMDVKSISSQAVVKIIVRNKGLKDTNFQVLKAKLEIVKYLAENGSFSTTSVDCCVSDVCEKIGDVKNGPLVCEVLTAMAEATSLNHVSAAVLDALFTQKSPKSQQEGLNWLSVAIKEFGIGGMNIKILIDNTKKGLASTNPGVRQTSISLLGVMYLYIGAALNVFFENEKPALRDQINAECDKYEGATVPTPTRGAVKKSASANSLDAVEDDGGGEPEPQINIQDLLPRVDISGKITDALVAEMEDKNWKVRQEALTKVSAIIQEAKLIKSNLGELPRALTARLTDSNVKIAQTSINICQEIVKAMGPPFKQYISTFFPGLLQTLGDNKAWMRTTALETMNVFADQCGYKEFFSGEMVGDALKSGSPVARAELWNWLAEVLPKIPPKSIPKEELMVCVPHLFSNLEDRNAEVRKNAQEAILGIMLHTGYEAMVKQTEKVKPSSKAGIVTALEKVRPNLPVKKLPEPERSAKPAAAAASSRQTVSKPKQSMAAQKAPAPSSRKKEEDVDTSPLLVVNNLKHQRTIDESKLKVLRWNFTTPREEFVELLKDQMSAANVNRGLIANMFHTDFRYHIKAIESLMEDLPSNSAALISNLDLILKWLTLRFFDTNPSVLLKGLEYLHSVFNTLVEKRYHMLENEGSCFIPYLIGKAGDPKDTVRNGVRSLLKQICGVFPVSRLSNYVMEGIKSKNARQRAECLEIMSSMIEDFNITVAPPACLKEIAKQISDRDNSVRNAALNCIVQAYNIVGEKVYKMVGNISDKDMSLLEERIKRASRRSVMPKLPPTVSTVTVEEVPMQQPVTNGERHNNTIVIKDEEQDIDEEENLPGINLPSTIPQEPPKKVITGPFKFESVFIKELDRVTPHFDKVPIQKIDTDFLKEDVKMPEYYDNKAKIMPLSPPKPVVANKYGISSSMKPAWDVEISRILDLVGTQNVAMGLQGVHQLLELLNNSSKSHMLADYENELILALVSQLQYLRTLDPSTDHLVAKLYRDMFKTIDLFYQNAHKGEKVTVPAIKEVMNQLILLLVEQKLERCGEIYVKVLNVNCVKIIEHSNHTVIICALIRLMKECIADENCPERQVDLVMKCLWKVIKLMPQWGNDVHYESVLEEVHQFLAKFPSKWWTGRPVDTPLRTIKTILHSTVKIKGANTMHLLGKIHNLGESEIEAYIIRLLKTSKIQQTQEMTAQPQKKAPLSKTNHNMLTDIFQKIGIKEQTKEGLNLLYDFIQQNPEADIEPYLSKSSKFFQDYIRNGLKEIEDGRKAGKLMSQCDVLNNKMTPPEFDPNKTPEFYQERLKKWRGIWDDLMMGKTVEHSEWPVSTTH